MNEYNITELHIAELHRLYFEWICKLIQTDSVEYSGYDNLLNVLSTTPFYAVIDRDENRIADGRDLEWMFLYEEGYDEAYWDIFKKDPVTCLEVLVALARKISTSIAGDISKGDRTADWFWRMIRNLGIYKTTPVNEIRYILENWLNRDFDFNGRGSPFPLQNPPGDERKTEILYQLYAYLQENFPV